MKKMLAVYIPFIGIDAITFNIRNEVVYDTLLASVNGEERLTAFELHRAIINNPEPWIRALGLQSVAFINARLIDSQEELEAQEQFEEDDPQPVDRDLPLEEEYAINNYAIFYTGN